MSPLDVTPVSKPNFPKLVDLSRPFLDYAGPTIDMNLVMEVQRKNSQAITSINQDLLESFQSYIQRQTELMTQRLQANTNLLTAITMAPTAQEKVMRQLEASKNAFDQCLSNVRYASETLAKCNQKVMEIVTNRLTEGLDELRQIGKTNLPLSMTTVTKG